MILRLYQNHFDTNGTIKRKIKFNSFKIIVRLNVTIKYVENLKNLYKLYFILI